MTKVLESIITVFRMCPGLKSLGVFVLLMVYLCLLFAVLERLLVPRSERQKSVHNKGPVSGNREENSGRKKKEALDSVEVQWSSPDYPQGWRGKRLR